MVGRGCITYINNEQYVQTDELDMNREQAN